MAKKGKEKINQKSEQRLTPEQGQKQVHLVMPKLVETGAPKLVEMTCPHCGGALKLLDATHASCPFCGASFLVDEPEDLNLHIHLPERKEKKRGEEKRATKEDARKRLISTFTTLFYLVTVLSLISGLFYGLTLLSNRHSMEENSLVEMRFYEDVLGKKYKELTQEDFNRIKFLSVENSYRLNHKTHYFVYYSFMDYAQCESREAFEETILKWEEELEPQKNILDFDRLQGLTYVDITLHPFYFSKMADITCARAKGLESLREKVCLDDLLRMAKLEKLELIDQDIELSGLEDCVNLRELSVKVSGYHGKNVIDVGVLGACTKLEKLTLDSSIPCIGLAKLSALQNLKEMQLAKATVEQCAFLKELKGLESLIIVVGEKHDLSNLNNLRGLKSLSLEQEEISVADLPKLPKLEYLHCRVNTQEDVDLIPESFPSLKQLSLEANVGMLLGQGIDATALGELKNLERLWLGSFSSTSVHHMECVLNLPNLEEMEIMTNMHLLRELYFDPEGLTERLQLRRLKLRYCEFYDEQTQEVSYEPIRRMTGLEELNMHGCYLEDISFLKGLPVLREVNLESNKIYDYSPLASCPQLEKVYVGDNPIIDPELPEQVEVISYTTENPW